MYQGDPPNTCCVRTDVQNNLNQDCKVLASGIKLLSVIIFNVMFLIQNFYPAANKLVLTQQAS